MQIRHAFVCIALCMIMAGCVSSGSIPTSTENRPAPGGAVAVWEIENLTVQGTAQPDISEFLSARVLETIKEEGDTVVERQKLLSVLEELSLGAGELSDPETKLRIGRIAGAKRMVFGSYQVIGQSMRIDLRMVEVETGRVLKASEKTVETNDLAGWLSAAEEAARNLVK